MMHDDPNDPNMCPVNRQLGFDYGEPAEHGEFGDVEGEYVMADVECYGRWGGVSP